jgi:hypothetical protein
MRLVASILRTVVILLLTLRVLASPLAMRPDSSRTPTTYHLVARVCSWPAQRPQRALSALSFAASFLPKGPDHGAGPGRGFETPKDLSLTGAASSRLVSPLSPGASLGQFSSPLRC